MDTSTSASRQAGVAQTSIANELGGLTLGEPLCSLLGNSQSSRWVCQHGEGDVTGSCRLFGGSCHAGALSLQQLALLRRPIPDSHVVACLQQVPCLHTPTDFTGHIT